MYTTYTRDIYGYVSVCVRVYICIYDIAVASPQPILLPLVNFIQVFIPSFLRPVSLGEANSTSGPRGGVAD